MQYFLSTDVKLHEKKRFKQNSAYQAGKLHNKIREVYPTLHPKKNFG